MYCNLLNDTLDMVVHEWEHDLNTDFENLSFQIDDIFIMMHYWCLETLVYVFITCVTFQQSIN